MSMFKGDVNYTGMTEELRATLEKEGKLQPKTQSRKSIKSKEDK